MKKAVIYLFSGTGNTKKVAELYQKAFKDNDIETTIFPIDRNLDKEIDTSPYDYVLFAYPIHAFNCPKNMLKFAKKIKNRKVNYSIIKSSGEPLKLNNVSSIKLNHILKRKGFNLVSEYHYVMPYNMIFRHTDYEATKMYQTCSKLIPIEAKEIINNVSYKLKYIPLLGHVFAWVLRIEQIAMPVNGKAFKINKKKCVNCGLCMKNCPVDNIYQDENGRLKFKGHCLMCTRCSFSCPKDAIRIGILNGWRVNGKYNFNYEGAPTKRKHGSYCRRAYANYFGEAKKKIQLDEAK